MRNHSYASRDTWLCISGCHQATPCSQRCQQIPEIPQHLGSAGDTLHGIHTMPLLDLCVKSDETWMFSVSRIIEEVGGFTVERRHPNVKAMSKVASTVKERWVSFSIRRDAFPGTPSSRYRPPHQRGPGDILNSMFCQTSKTAHGEPLFRSLQHYAHDKNSENKGWVKKYVVQFQAIQINIYTKEDR